MKAKAVGSICFLLLHNSDLKVMEEGREWALRVRHEVLVAGTLKNHSG